VFIASHWTPESSPTVRVFSNCEEVGLVLNGELRERREPDVDRISTHLAYPPFTFQLKRFEPGTLEAIGYIGGRKAAHHVVRTPGSAKRLTMRLDESFRPFAAGGMDVAFVHAELKDEIGTIVPGAWENVFFGCTGDIELVGANPFSADAGIASILVRSEVRDPRGAVFALCLPREGDRFRTLGAALPLSGEVPPLEIRVTTDGSDPATGPAYRGERLYSSQRVRAALFAGRALVATADTEAPKFRIAGSTAPA
jgi:hypothetical protein